MSIAKEILNLLKKSPERIMKWSDIYNLLRHMGFKKSAISMAKDRLIQKGIISEEVVDGEKIVRLEKDPDDKEEVVDLVLKKLDAAGIREDRVYDIRKVLKFFFKEYLCKIDRITTWLEIDWKELAKYCISYGVDEFLDVLVDYPGVALDLMNVAFREAYVELHEEEPKGIRVTLKNTPDECKTTIEDIRSKDIGRLVEFEGIVAMATKVHTALVRGTYICPHCGEITSITIDPLNPPTPLNKIKCKCGEDAYLDEDLSEYIDYQELKLQQPVETMKNLLDPPKYITVIHENAKGIFSGRVKVIGIPTRIKKKGGKSIYEIMVRAINVIPIDNVRKDVNLSKEELETIKKISKLPNVIDTLADLLLFEIKGWEEIKKAIFLQQVRGVPKYPRSSGVIHILLIADPGIGKSTMLEAVSQIPGNTFASLSTATAAGITATVEKMKTEIGDDTWVVKPGVIPRAHGGTACLDEFTSNKSVDQSLLECMSRERITISKASIHAVLPAATSILAACNPVDGQYDPNIPVIDQINICDPILNRFDLIFALKNTFDEQRDSAMADHILDLYEYACNPDKSIPPSERVVEIDGEEITITQELLYKYILYARSLRPELTKGAREELKRFFLELKRATQNAKIRATARQLESAVKLAGAVAKAKLKDTIDAEDAREAIDLMKYCYENIAKDDDRIDFRMIVGPKMTKYEKMEKIYEILCDLCTIKGSAVPKEELLKECREEGLDISEEELDELLEKMKKRGEIYEPKFEYYRIT